LISGGSARESNARSALADEDPSGYEVAPIDVRHGHHRLSLIMSAKEMLLKWKGPWVNGEAYHRPISVPAVSRAQQLSRAIVYFLLIGRQNFFEAILLFPA
jgi:hypothetical protein